MKFPRTLSNSFIVAEHAWEALYKSVSEHDKTVNIIECGVFEGYTSALLNFSLQKSNLSFVQYAADTFSGFPYKPEETKKFKAGDLKPANGLHTARELQRLGITPLIGKVEDSLKLLESEKFVFVFVDLDIILPTEFCAKFFLNRIREGGRIGFHDYNEAPGTSLKIAEVVQKYYSKNKNYREVFRAKKNERDGKFIFFERI